MIRTLGILMALFSLPLAALGAEVNLHMKLSKGGNIVGTSSDLSGEVVKFADGTFRTEKLVLKLDSLDTKNSLRNTHMKKNYFETSKYPDAIFKGMGKPDGKLEGQLTLRGITRPVTGTYKAEKDAIVAKFTCKISEFGMKPPSFLGVSVADEVEVEGNYPYKMGGAAPAPAAPKPAAAPVTKKKS